MYKTKELSSNERLVRERLQYLIDSYADGSAAEFSRMTGLVAYGLWCSYVIF